MEYGNYKKFNENNFLYELDQELNKGSIYKEKHYQYYVFTNTFRMVLDKHAPIKKKIVRGNEAPFMTKELSKTIMKRSKLKNRYTKCPSRKIFLPFKKQKNNGMNLNKKTEKKRLFQNYFKWSNGKQIILANSQIFSDVQRFSP